MFLLERKPRLVDVCRDTTSDIRQRRDVANVLDSSKNHHIDDTTMELEAGVGTQPDLASSLFGDRRSSGSRPGSKRESEGSMQQGSRLSVGFGGSLETSERTFSKHLDWGNGDSLNKLSSRMRKKMTMNFVRGYPFSVFYNEREQLSPDAEVL